jgi:hypothetical protein
MATGISSAKRINLIQDTAAQRWSRLYVDVRASYGRAAIQSALLLGELLSPCSPFWAISPLPSKQRAWRETL